MPPRRFLSITAVVAVLGGLAGAAPASALADPEYARQWGVQVIGAKAAWDAGLFGEGVEIAIVDSGVHLSHQDLRRNVVPGRNFVDPARSPQDDNEHGTHVAGIAAASIDDGGTVGVAPRAKIVPLKVLRADGSGSGANVAAAIRFAADSGAEVINLSLGEDTQAVLGPSTADAVRYAWSKGSICVFAAGNDFVLTSGFEDEPALVVSSTSRNDRASDFSNGVGNAKWGIAAPGGAESVLEGSAEDIFSTVWVSDQRTDTYAHLAGTSMSAPHVAGAAALLRAAGLSPQQTVDRLLSTAKDLGPAGRDSTFGAGRLDVAKAVAGLPANGAAAPTSPPPAGSPATTAAPGPTTTAGASPRSTSRSAPPVAPPAAPRTSAAGPAAPPAPTPEPIASDPIVTPEPDAPAAEPDAGLLGGDEPAPPAALGAPVAAVRDADQGPPWLLVLVATAAALGVGAVTGRQLWRRRAASGTAR